MCRNANNLPIVESPAKNWPESFGRISLFQRFPYLLPTLIASSVLLTGAILSLFLAWDGGPRQGAIRLLPEKITDVESRPEVSTDVATTSINLAGSPLGEEDDERTPSFGVLGNVMRTKISGYFAQRVREAHGQSGSPSGEDTPGSRPGPARLGAPTSVKARAYSRGRVSFSGSAYGYRPRHGSQSTYNTAGRRDSGVTVRRGGDSIPHEDGTTAPQEELSLAQRLLIGE